MAAARQWLSTNYNRLGFDLFDFNIYALCGDGDMMEGVASEAASLAGHLRLSNLCWIYDSNRVTIEGHTDIAFTEDVAARFLAYGWNVLRVTDANDTERLERAYHEFLATENRPTLIIVHSHIGYGSPHKHDLPEAHGEPLGEEEVRLTKQFFGFDPAQYFVVPDGVRQHFSAQLGARGARLNAEWQDTFQRYCKQYPDLGEQVVCMSKRGLPPEWQAALPVFPPSATGLSTRDASGKVLNAVAERIPWIIGGAADLTPSTKTRLTFEGAGDFQPGGPVGDYSGRNMHFGVREHAMCCRGQRHDSDRTARLRVRFSDFHGLCSGCDPACLVDGPAGPAHLDRTIRSVSARTVQPIEPIEQLVSLRAIPGMVVIRPADANEMSEAYRCILQLQHRPTALICSRQPLPIVDRTQVRAGCRTCERCRCADRCARRQAGRDPHRQRQRSHAMPHGMRQARGGRRQDARRQHAVMGAVRRTGCCVPRQRAAAFGNGAGDRRRGLADQVGNAMPGHVASCWACAPSACPLQ